MNIDPEALGEDSASVFGDRIAAYLYSKFLCLALTTISMDLIYNIIKQCVSISTKHLHFQFQFDLNSNSNSKMCAHP